MNPEREKVERQLAEIAASLFQRLKEVFPEAVVKGRIDFDSLRLTLGEEVDTQQERYSLTWAGKRDAIRLLQVPSRVALISCPKESRLEATNQTAPNIGNRD